MYERYVQLRDEHGLRDADVARMTGITPSTFTMNSGLQKIRVMIWVMKLKKGPSTEFNRWRSFGKERAYAHPLSGP